VGNFVGGILTIYLVTTAWLTARRSDRETGLFDWAALLIPLGVGVSTLTLGIQKVSNPAALDDGVPVGMNFFMGTVVLLAAAGDVRMIVRGISGTRRIARHLWRMCFGLFFASGSIFIARPHLFPAWLSTTHILLFLGVMPLLLMIFWLVRVRFTKTYKRDASSYRAHVDWTTLGQQSSRHERRNRSHQASARHVAYEKTLYCQPPPRAW
jgi:hypothetical protein